MNKKGMSLIEIICALMILSIAGIMIFSGFLAVLRFVNSANELQYESDTLLSYAEKSSDSGIRDVVQADRKPSSYTISNGLGNKVVVATNITTLTLAKNHTINLRSIKNELNELVKDTPSYKQAMLDASDLYDQINKYILGPPLIEDYNAIFKAIYTNDYKNGWKNFNRELLPKKLGQLSSDANEFKIVGYFPWEFFQDPKFNNGKALIYLSQTYVVGAPTSNDEIIHVIYDYIEGSWYYFPEDDYKIIYKGYLFSEMKFEYKGSNKVITSYEALLNHIKAKESGWYKLDKDIEFDKRFPDDSWIPIK